MKILRVEDPDYPQNLKGIDSAPSTLYIQGHIIKEDMHAVAIVGTRKMTSYGRKMAELFSAELAREGITIVSGLARGVDSIAHRGALGVGGRTIAVLGHGLDMVYPREHAVLAGEIARHGALVSEFPLGFKPWPKNFLARNRIISGLSKIVLVIEGAKRSGTLSTVNWAASQGREVFALPGRIDSEMSEMPNYLIENGANIARTPKDVLDALV